MRTIASGSSAVANSCRLILDQAIHKARIPNRESRRQITPHGGLKVFRSVVDPVRESTRNYLLVHSRQRSSELARIEIKRQHGSAYVCSSVVNAFHVRDCEPC